MNQNYSLLYFLKKPKGYEGGEIPIYMRITANGGQRKEVSVGRTCDPKIWISSANRAKGNLETVKMLNSYLDAIDRQIEMIHTNLTKYGMDISAETIMNKYLGKEERPMQLMQIFAEHNLKMEESIGKIYKASTLKGFRSSVNHLTGYLKKDFKARDINIRKIDHAFLVGYEYYLRTEKNLSEISAAKYLTHFRKIINLCLAHRWIDANPFVFYKKNPKPLPKQFLTMHELRTMAEKNFSIKRLEQVRDIFLFCCYTGLSYADVKKLKCNEIKTGDDGNLWIFTTREKKR